MPFILQYIDYDDYEILGLYHTREEAEAAEKRYVEVEIPRQVAEDKARFRWAVENDSDYTEEDIAETDAHLDENAVRMVDKLHVWELEFGDGWTHNSHTGLE